MTPASAEALVDEFGVACCMLYEECNATPAEALKNLHDGCVDERAALLKFIADKDAELADALRHSKQHFDQAMSNGAAANAERERAEKAGAELADAVRARDSALEDAAKCCDEMGRAWKADAHTDRAVQHDFAWTADACAAAIRALACVVVKDSARTCQRGTKGCERNHQ